MINEIAKEHLFAKACSLLASPEIEIVANAIVYLYR